MAAEFQGLVQAIRKKIGGRGDVSMDQSRFVVVVGDPETNRGVAPILNLTCELTNEWDRSVVIRPAGSRGQRSWGEGVQSSLASLLRHRARTQTPSIEQRTLYEGNSILRGGREARVEEPKVERSLEGLVIE